MKLPAHKTKIVCTIGPASRSETILERLMLLGMNVARLNFAHGTLDGHRDDIRRIRAVAKKLQLPCKRAWMPLVFLLLKQERTS